MTLPSDLPQAGVARPVSFNDLERVFACLSDGILVIRADRSIAYANPAFALLWRVPGELMDFKNDFALMNHVLSQLAEPAAFIREVERLYSSIESSLDELAFKDGRTFRRQSVSMENPGEQPSRIWIFSDISELQVSAGMPAALARATPEARKPGLFGGIFKN